MSVPPPSFCKSCNHGKKFHKSNVDFCTVIQCLCQNYIPPNTVLVEEIQQQVVLLNSIGERCEYILRNMKWSRNLTNWEFVRLYWHVTHGFCTGMRWTNRIIPDLTEPMSIRRAKNQVVKESPTLAATDADLIKHKNLKYEGTLEWWLEHNV